MNLSCNIQQIGLKKRIKNTFGTAKIVNNTVDNKNTKTNTIAFSSLNSLIVSCEIYHFTYDIPFNF